MGHNDESQQHFAWAQRMDPHVGHALNQYLLGNRDLTTSLVEVVEDLYHRNNVPRVLREIEERLDPPNHLSDAEEAFLEHLATLLRERGSKVVSDQDTTSTRESVVLGKQEVEQGAVRDGLVTPLVPWTTQKNGSPVVPYGLGDDGCYVATVHSLATFGPRLNPLDPLDGTEATSLPLVGFPNKVWVLPGHGSVIGQTSESFLFGPKLFPVFFPHPRYRELGLHITAGVMGVSGVQSPLVLIIYNTGTNTCKVYPHQGIVGVRFFRTQI